MNDNRTVISYIICPILKILVQFCRNNMSYSLIRMKKNPVILFVLFALFSACSSKDDAKKQPAAANNKNAPVNVEGYIVKTSSISNNIEVPGNITPYESTELHPEVAGRVVALNINEGSNVKKGTMLVKLFDGDLQAQLNKLQVQLGISQKTYQRQGELIKISGISQQEYDLSSLDVSNIRADIDVIKTSIAKTEVRAPFDGRLGLRNISLGAYITTQTILTTIQQVNQLKLQFTIPEKYARNISQTREITFTTEGYNRKFTAKVLATEASVTENNRSLTIKAVVTSKDAKLFPGAFAKVMFDFGKNDSALMIPSQAVIPGVRNKQVILYKKGKPVFVVVGTGIRDSSQVQILSGINAGDTILITGLLTIKPQSKLKLAKIATSKEATALQNMESDDASGPSAESKH